MKASTKKVWIRLTPKTAARLDKIAHVLRRTRVSLMEQIIEEYAVAHDGKERAQ